MGKTSKTILYFTLGNYSVKISPEAFSENFHEISKMIQKIQHNTFCCSVEKFNSWSGDPPRTRRARAPNETPPSGNHHILSQPHHLSCKPGALHGRREIRRLAHGKLGRLVDGELQVNSIVPLLASASLLAYSEWHLLVLTLHLLCLTATSTRLQLSVSRLTRPKFLPFPCLGDAQRVCMANHLALVLTWC